MKKPQKEKWRVLVPDKIIKNFCRTKLTKLEFRVVWLITAHTFIMGDDGWAHKDHTVRLTLREFQEFTESDKSNCHKALKSLINKGIVIKKVTPKGITYKIRRVWKVV